MTDDPVRRPVVTRGRCGHCRRVRQLTLTIGVGARCHSCGRWSQWWQVIGRLKAPPNHTNTTDPEEDL